MSLMSLSGPLRNANIAFDSWLSEAQQRGERVSMYRRYRDGDFDANLTPEMRRLLRVRPSVNNTSEFGINYCDVVVTTYTDRLEVQSLDSQDEAARDYVAQALRLNRFDNLQIDVHDAAAVDADTFLLVDWDNERQRVRLTHEAAFDGTTGIIPVYSRTNSREMYAAVKVWQETTHAYADTLRITIYYRDRIQRMSGAVGGKGGITVLSDEKWDVGQVPVVAFTNRARGRLPYGLSELENVIPLQDSLNRTLHSMVMASELSAFQIRYAIGTKAPVGLTPGMFVDIYSSDSQGNPVPPADSEIEWLKSIRFGAFEQGDIGDYLKQAQFLIEQIHDVSKTPYLKLSSKASGEAMKQAEISLLSKVRRAQVRLGNSWEQVAQLIVATGREYGRAQLNADAEFNCAWRDAEVRDDAQTLDMALRSQPLMGDEFAVKQAGRAFNLSAEEVNQIVEQRKAQDIRQLQALAFSGANRFGASE